MTLDGFKLLKNPLSKMINLKELYLGNNNITDNSCIHLVQALENLTRLNG